MSTIDKMRAYVAEQKQFLNESIADNDPPAKLGMYAACAGTADDLAALADAAIAETRRATIAECVAALEAFEIPASEEYGGQRACMAKAVEIVKGLEKMQ